jgi:hypothetical protein
MWDELNKFDRGRFAGSNTLVFLPPWTSEQIDWWQENIFKPHGYYPDDLGEALSASASGAKTITLMDMDPKANSFVIKVKGRADDMGEAWWHQRKLDLKGRLFRAEKMIVPFPDQRQGKGRLLMADLVDTARRRRTGSYLASRSMARFRRQFEGLRSERKSGEDRDRQGGTAGDRRQLDRNVRP